MKSYIIIFLFTLVNLLLILSDVYLSIEIEYNKFTQSGVTVIGKDAFGKNVTNSTKFCDNSLECYQDMCKIWYVRNVLHIVLEPNKNKKPDQCLVYMIDLWKAIANDFTLEAISVLWLCVFGANLIYPLLILSKTEEIIIRKMCKVMLIINIVLFIILPISFISLHPYYISKFVLYWTIACFDMVLITLLN